MVSAVFSWVSLALKASAFLLLVKIHNAVEFETIKLSLPWPSGIQIDKVSDAQGRTYRFGRLQHNAISLRPAWSSVNVIDDVFTDQECSEIIQLAETYAGQFGWSKGRHIDYDVRPTQDLPVQILFEDEKDLENVYERFREKIYPRIAQQYNLDAEMIHVSDLFITKYDAERKERSLALHQDKSPWSFVIPLNADFSGGGTYFPDSKVKWNPPVGSALYFNGIQYHGAPAVTSGVRYILAGFCEYGDIDNTLNLSEENHAAFMALYQSEYDGSAALHGFRTGDMIVGLEICEKVALTACDASTAVCDASTVPKSESSDTEIQRRMVEISGTTSDDEWIGYAQSCEQLQPGSDTVLYVRRRRRR